MTCDCITCFVIAFLICIETPVAAESEERRDRRENREGRKIKTKNKVTIIRR
jgi:hypothetical protein